MKLKYKTHIASNGQVVLKIYDENETLLDEIYLPALPNTGVNTITTKALWKSWADSINEE